MDQNFASSNFKTIDPLNLEKYLEGVTFPATQDDIMLAVRGNDAPQEVVEQMEEMLRSGNFNDLEQFYNEMAGAYDDGEATGSNEEE